MQQSPAPSPLAIASDGEHNRTLAPLADIIGDDARSLGVALGLSASAIERLVAAVRSAGQPPAVAASLLGLAKDDQVASCVADLHAVPLWEDLEAKPAVDCPAELNPKYLAENYGLVLEGSDPLLIGLVDPGARGVREAIAFAAGRPVEFRTVSLNYWRTARGTGGNDAGQDLSFEGWGDDVERLRDFARDAPIVRFLDGLLERAALSGASDVHVEQKSDRSLVRFRIDGDLRDIESLGPGFGAGLIARIKVLADLDVAAVRAPQDGRTTVSIRGAPTDLRISTTPTAHGESAVVRLLARQGLDFTLDSLGFGAPFLTAFEAQLRRPHGLILVTGPTGSGKTTTLYAALRALATRDRKVLTVEDPIEYVFEDINQTQVNEAAGVTFASALRSFLRHDPDVILVGEIRDSETARLAVQAALTGHLVLATLHTNDAPSAPARLADLGVERYLLASVLVGVSAQRLVPKVCIGCAVPRVPHTHEAELFTRNGFDLKQIRLREGTGCERCAGRGRLGRLPIGEAFKVDDAVERLIATAAPTADIRGHLTAHAGFLGLGDEALRCAAAGDVAIADALRIAGL